ncbi:hypothetical protein D1641_12690 [Colidextribacter sp. OB.20]|nr:hypothetical protein [Colidextribacter sp. OB.20]
MEMMQMGSWKNWFQPHILERGRTYFDEGRVSDLERTEDSYTATVEGTEEYEVEILLDGDSIEDMICDCPYAEDGNACKHMAAVLFAVAAAEPSKKKAPAKKECLTPASLVEKIPDSQLRPLLTELVSADEKLYRALLLRYGKTSLDECMKTLRKELTFIGRQYADRDGYIDYYHAGAFSEAIADHIQRQTETLLARNEPLLAFQAGVDALREYSGYGIDGSNGEYGLVMEAMEDMCVDVLAATDEIVAEKIFDLLAGCAKSDQEEWFVQEFASQMVFSHFAGKYFDEKKLALVDEQISALTLSGKKDYSSEYKIEKLLTCRFDLMKKLSSPKEELDAFLNRYTSYSNIRKLCVQQALDEGKTDEAIRLLEEGKSADRDKRGLVAGYSEWLTDLYERQGRRDKLIAELEYHVFVLSSGGMEMLNRLKKACAPAQWIEYRERYLSGRNYYRLELMESEGLWERLMEAVAAAGSLSILDRYEAALKKRYPNEMLEAYACILTKEAAAASDRKRYQELARYLKKLRNYPGGAERAAQLAEDWRTRYIRRRAMMEELRNAGF